MLRKYLDIAFLGICLFRYIFLLLLKSTGASYVYITCSLGNTLV